MIGKRFRFLPFIFANDNYTLRTGFVKAVQKMQGKNGTNVENAFCIDIPWIKS